MACDLFTSLQTFGAALALKARASTGLLKPSFFHSSMCAKVPRWHWLNVGPDGAPLGPKKTSGIGRWSCGFHVSKQLQNIINLGQLLGLLKSKKQSKQDLHLLPVDTCPR